MKKIFFATIIIIMVSCLKPARDNEFDPNNPDKAYLTGKVNSPEGEVKNAKVELLTLDHEFYDSTFTDAEGTYEFSDIDPGIYKIMAFAPYYLPEEYYPESLPAGTTDTVDLYFSKMFFNFDNDSVGTIEPFDFKRIAGNWKVAEDNSAPSPPNVYNCFALHGLALYNQPVANFAIGTKFKFNTPPDSLSQAGVVLRLQDSLNYYIVSAASRMLLFGKVVDGDFTVIDYAQVFVAHNQWYNLWIEVCDQQFKIYFNDELKIDRTDDSFDAGKTGLLIEREGGNQISVNFDDVVICR